MTEDNSATERSVLHYRSREGLVVEMPRTSIFSRVITHFMCRYPGVG